MHNEKEQREHLDTIQDIQGILQKFKLKTRASMDLTFGLAA